jgi:hypothetical protein
MQDALARREGRLMKAPILLVLVGLSMSLAKAAEPAGTLTLACQGTVKTYRWDKDTGKTTIEDKPVSMNVAVNFTAQKVEGSQGLSGEMSGSTNELIISFEKVRERFSDPKVGGTINRMTGELYGEIETTNKDLWLSENYSLKCKPTQRMF